MVGRGLLPLPKNPTPTLGLRSSPNKKSWTRPKKNTALLHMRIEEVLMCIRQTIMITDLMLLT